MVRPLVVELAERLATQKVDVVCGPLVEGAYVGLMVAEELDAEFGYSLRIEHPDKKDLFPVEYRVPEVLRAKLRGKRVAIVNDVINAGSAVRGTAADVVACGAELAALATLATIGNSAAEIAQQYAVPLVSLATIAGEIWKPDHCPLCRDGVPITR
jgi:orotate phosphoribosyltransferase